jgi:hypothetical protein|tara:strand:- start:727 stop:1911 length:1185 start_codon:yes stop_codon:yes gene_type:complete
MKKLILLVAILISYSSNAQFLSEIYTDFLKYGTFYAAGDISNSYQPLQKNYVVRTNSDGSLYSIPDVEDMTENHPFDYRLGVGLRKLARFSYEVKGANFYTGATDGENNMALSSPTAAVDGFEYLFHWETARQRGDMFDNHRYFIRHTGDYHIVKFESREAGNINFKYNSAEVRGRLPIGKKFSLSAGAIFRTHQESFGYNPIEIWLNETDVDGNAINPWYALGRTYGYTDHYTTYTDTDGTITNDWIWKDSDGNIVAYTDLDFRERIYPGLMNQYNQSIYSLLPLFGEIAPVVGFDFYHYKDDFWLHAYGNVVLPLHTYIMGEHDFTYGNRNNWGIGGLEEGSKFEQWTDVQFGLMFGAKLSKTLGIFVEGEYSQLWDRELFQTTFGFNYTFR